MRGSARTRRPRPPCGDPVPVLEYLGRLLDEYRELETARSRPTSRSSGRPTRAGSGSASSRSTATSTRSATPTSSSPSSRSPSRSCSGWRSRTTGPTRCSKVGVEPTATPFNSIVVDEREPAVQPHGERRRHRGHRLIDGVRRRRTDRRASSTRSRATPAAPRVDEAVFRSESETGDRNRAIAHLMRNFGMLRRRSRRRRSTPTSASARCS